MVSAELQTRSTISRVGVCPLETEGITNVGRSMLRPFSNQPSLSAIPAVLEAPTKALVIYGQPEVEGQIKRGLVCIEVSDEIKRRARGFIELMEKSEP